MMKIPFLLLIALPVIQACKKNYSHPDPYPAIYASFEVKNESGRDAMIYLYRPDNKLLKQVVLDDADSAIINGGRTGSHNPYFSLYDILDSAKIEFIDGKQLIQTSRNRKNDDTINNILYTRCYKIYGERRRFTLTKNDYDRAQ